MHTVVHFVMSAAIQEAPKTERQTKDCGKTNGGAAGRHGGGGGGRGAQSATLCGKVKKAACLRQTGWERFGHCHAYLKPGPTHGRFRTVGTEEESTKTL